MKPCLYSFLVIILSLHRVLPMRPASFWYTKIELENICVEKQSVLVLVCTKKYIQAFQISTLACSAKQPFLVMALRSAVDLN